MAKPRRLATAVTGRRSNRANAGGQRVFLTSPRADATLFCRETRGVEVSRLFQIKTMVGLLSLGLIAGFAWLRPEITATPHTRLVFWTGMAFAALVVFRRAAPRESMGPSGVALARTAGGGTVLSVAGLVGDVHQFHWLGVLLLVYAGLRWSLPERAGQNLAAALFVLYWAHPLPGTLFGRVQLGLQHVSVYGAEWILHAFNVPVWADGIFLRTGERVFEVPEACSGMNTTMIVVVCALGAGALVQLSAARRLVLMGAGFIQVLALNGLRIALMVAASRGKPADWSVTYIHDSTAVLMVLMIAVIQAEAVVWARYGEPFATWLRIRRARRAKRWTFSRPTDLVRPQLEIGIILALAAAVLLGTVFMIARRRPEHRARMVATVASDLARADLSQAERAARAAARLVPGNREYRMLVARIELTRGRYSAALEDLRAMEPVPRDPAAIQLVAWGLLGAGQLEEAHRLLGRLSHEQATHPGVAICSAELAVRRDDPEGAASNVVYASAWPILTERVRRTYPFLARHGQWGAIARSASSAPYRDAGEFRIMLAALMAGDDFPSLARLLASNRALWCGKPDFLPHLQELALRGPDPRWQQVYADSLAEALPGLGADALAASCESCFLMARPDLAWPVFRRLAVMDASHPALTLIPARFADAWFVFQGSAAEGATAATGVQDLRPLLRLVGDQPPWKRLLESVPLGTLMLAGPEGRPVASWTKAGLDELSRREKSGTISYDQYALYGRSLQWAQQDTEALAVLDRMEKLYPERIVEILSSRAKIHRAHSDWQSLYEILRRIRSLRPNLDPSLQLTLTETLARLDMGVCALEYALEAAERQPASRAWSAVLASIWEQFGHAEESLYALRTLPKLPPSPSVASLLWRTGRYAQACQMYGQLGMARDAARKPVALPALPPAESVLEWPHREGGASPFEIDELDARIRGDKSPFLRALHVLTRDWASGRDRQRLLDPSLWRQAGRDRLEQVTALHRLAFLAAEAGDRVVSARALDEGLQLMPNARLLWRMRIAIARGDAKVVAAARAACPRDADIWLAEVAVCLRSRQVAAAAALLREACAGDRYSPATLVRAGRALLRAGDAASAAMAADQVLERSNDYLPACLLGLDAAVALNDAERGVPLALRTAPLAPDPLPFFEIAVRLGMSRADGQLALTPALEALVAGEPANPEWSLRLGTVYFNEGLYDQARHSFRRWMLAPPRGIPSGVLIMMAESARGSGDLAQSVMILREAYRRYPHDLHVVNSLAYTLAQSPTTALEARQFLPLLLAAAPTASVLDSIAVIRLRSGEVDAARGPTQEALAKLKPGDPHWREIYLNAAESECALGHVAEAERLLKRARQQPLKGAPVDARMTALQSRIVELKRSAAGIGN